jgi:ubiquinone/menaquinone biosynthesis C-methylase UbiE
MTIPIKIISKKDLKQIPEQENVWDSISIPWEKYVVKKVPIVSNFLKEKKGKIIDIGCGSGRNMLKNKDVEYYAIDFSSCQLGNAMGYAKDNNINAKFFKLRADKLSKKDTEQKLFGFNSVPSNSKSEKFDGFKENMFDAGLFIATLHCLETEKERENAVKEFYRVLKKGSEGLISVWNSKDARFNSKKGDIYMGWKDEGVSYMRYYYLYDKQELVDLLESVGFKIEEIYEPTEHDRFSKKNLIIRVKKV